MRDIIGIGAPGGIGEWSTVGDVTARDEAGAASIARPASRVSRRRQQPDPTLPTNRGIVGSGCWHLCLFLWRAGDGPEWTWMSEQTVKVLAEAVKLIEWWMC